MDPERAQHLIDLLYSADNALADAYFSLGEESDVLDAATRALLQRRIATLISLLGTGVERQLWKSYPDLCPDELRDTLALRLSASQEWPIAMGRQPRE